jgi:hypothetical protein
MGVIVNKIAFKMEVNGYKWFMELVTWLVSYLLINI